jgi:1-acyl-sn-glycerol-3-phosphate acyltransferase
MHKSLGALGGRIDAVFYCPHSPDEGCSLPQAAAGPVRADRRALRRRPQAPRTWWATRRATCRPARRRLPAAPGADRQGRSSLRGQPLLPDTYPADTRVHQDLAAFADWLVARGPRRRPGRLTACDDCAPMALLRSLLHALWMLVTVVPWGIWMVTVLALVQRRADVLEGGALAGLADRRACASCAACSARHRHGEPAAGQDQPGILLVKHQSTLETFLMPTLMPHPLAYVFKRELIYIPFFGWAMGRMDMIHIDRSQRAQAFNKVVEQGKRLLAQGIWVIMFPEGTRIPRGQKGNYKSGGTRLAVATGAPVIPIAVTSAKVWPRKAFIKRPASSTCRSASRFPAKAAAPTN